MPVPEREAIVGPRPHLGGRDDVEHSERADALGMVERHSVRDAAATIVPGDGESLKAERSHRLDLVERERALGMRARGRPPAPDEASRRTRTDRSRRP